MSVDAERKALGDSSPNVLRVRQAFAALRCLSMNLNAEGCLLALLDGRKVRAESVARRAAIHVTQAKTTLGELCNHGLVERVEVSSFPEGLAYLYFANIAGWRRLADDIAALAEAVAARASIVSPRLERVV